MLTTFDRYLLKRYLHAFVILFVCLYGLFVVIDGFTNVDGFQQGQETAAGVLRQMTSYYAFQMFQFLDYIGPILTVIATMVVFATLQSHREFHPVLAAGIPTIRLLLPVIIGTLLVSTLIVVNQELVIPQIAHRLQSPRGQKKMRGTRVEPIYDFKTRIAIDGKALHLRERRLENAKFVLPAPEISIDLTVLKSAEAIYFSENGEQPGGWLLRNVQPAFDTISLTPQGKKYVLRTKNSNDLFIVTDLGFDQLSNRSKNYRYLSTLQLMQRIKNPSTGLTSIRGQLLFFHTRLVRPLISLIAIFLVVPLVLRRESRGLIVNMAVCALVMSVLFGVNQLFSFMGGANIIPPDFAAWLPVIFNGACGVWLFGLVQT